MHCRKCGHWPSEPAEFCPRCGAAQTGAAAGPPRVVVEKRPIGAANKLLAVVAVVLGAIVAIAYWGSRASDDHGATTAQPHQAGPARPVAASAPAAPSKPDDEVLAERLWQADFATAVSRALPGMADTTNEASPGAAMLAIWASRRMTLEDVAVAKNETSVRLVAKDSDAARGKRMCVSGHLVEIERQDTVEGEHVFVGILQTASWDLIHFYAARDTGSLVERSRARICGVVTGRFTYSNSGGGTGHAVELVGVFDLPQNRPARPAAEPAKRTRTEDRPIHRVCRTGADGQMECRDAGDWPAVPSAAPTETPPPDSDPASELE